MKRLRVSIIGSAHSRSNVYGVHFETDGARHRAKRAPMAVVMVMATMLLLGFGGAGSAQVTGDTGYGVELARVRGLGIGPTMAAAVAGDRLFTVGRGTLRAFDIAVPADPKLLGSLDGLGWTRQIAVTGDVAYVSSRPYGVFIVSVRDPRRPELLSHFDSIGVAIGIAVAGPVLFVACTSHGVEMVDVSDPRRPRHLGTARTGEAQSVAVHDGYAYVGVWGSSELVVVDARNPRAPAITARCPLDGYGDGVAVRGSLVFVATGHHSRTAPRTKPGDPGYGHGHGLEIFDISDPAKPVFVSRVKTPPFYRLGNDMWSVRAVGEHAFVADTYNGIFVVNVADPAKPRFVGHWQLPRVAADGGVPDFAGGLALARDHVYVAGGGTDLHVLAAPGLAMPAPPDLGAPPRIPPFQPRPTPGFQVYRPEGQVRAVAFLGDVAVVAAGSDGVHLVELKPEPRLLTRYDTEGLAMEVAVTGDLVCVAEERGGLSIWKSVGRGALRRVARYRPQGQIAFRVVIPSPGRYALVQLGFGILEIVDLSDPSTPKSVFRDAGHAGHTVAGMTHGYVWHIGEDLVEGRYLPVEWQLDGIHWYDLYGGAAPAISSRRYPHRLDSGGLFVSGRETYIVGRGGIAAVRPDERRPPAKLPWREVPGCNLKCHDRRGTPRLFGKRLYVADRAIGDVTVVDVSDPERPALVERFNVPGNPGKLLLHDGALIIPNGYEGLWIGWPRAESGPRANESTRR
jgi:hypothetical protein